MKPNQNLTTKANYSARTFTIRKDGSKYRTSQFSKDDFEDALYWSENDWKAFLRNETGCYFLIK